MPLRWGDAVRALLGLALALPPVAAAGAAPSGDMTRPVIERIKGDPALYAGEGQADFNKEDRGAARDKARDRALADLSKKIRTQLEVIVRDEVGYRSDGKKFSSEEAFRQIINSRTDQAINGYEDRDFLDYPMPAMYTVIVSVDKRKVDEETRADLAGKKEKVTELIKEAAAFRKQKNISAAIKSYLAARESIGLFFTGLPVTAALEDRPVELGAHVDSRLEELLGGLSIRAVKDAVRYTVEGKPREAAAVTVDLKTDQGAEPAAKIPLSVRFSKGSGRLGRSEALTDSSGKAELPLEWVDPAQTAAALEVTLGSELTGRLPAQVARPSCEIALSRGKSISYFIRSRLDGAAAPPGGLEREARAALREAGFDAVELAPAAKDDDASLLHRARKAHADYLLIWSLSARARQEAGLDIFSAQGGGSAYLLDLTDRNEVFSATAPAAKGFGASAAVAGEDALAKLRKELVRQVREKIRGVR